MEKRMSREEVMEAIKQAAKELGHVPTIHELKAKTRVGAYDIRKHFGVYTMALEACGLERHGSGYHLNRDQIFEDWSQVTRLLGKIPTLVEYSLYGRYSPKPLTRHFGEWKCLPARMAEHAREHGMKDNFKDVLEVVDRHVESGGRARRNFSRDSRPILRPGLMPGERIYGPPTVDAHLMLAPVNEQGVLLLFGAVARKLGFVVLQVQTEYPDCEALREMEMNKWQRVRIEFEYESRNFLLHKHPPEKCHLIVCWKHNWEEAPVEVIELESAIKEIG
jgi:Homing endonuclease associated repeat